MSSTTEHILQAALALPLDEQMELIDALMVALDEANQSLDEAWRAEIRRRSAAIDAGTAVFTPWPEVKRRVRERLEGRSGD